MHLAQVSLGPGQGAMLRAAADPAAKPSGAVAGLGSRAAPVALPPRAGLCSQRRRGCRAALSTRLRLRSQPRSRALPNRTDPRPLSARLQDSVIPGSPASQSACRSLRSWTPALGFLLLRLSPLSQALSTLLRISRLFSGSPLSPGFSLLSRVFPSPKLPVVASSLLSRAVASAFIRLPASPLLPITPPSSRISPLSQGSFLFPRLYPLARPPTLSHGSLPPLP